MKTLSHCQSQFFTIISIFNWQIEWIQIFLAECPIELKITINFDCNLYLAATQFTHYHFLWRMSISKVCEANRFEFESERKNLSTYNGCCIVIVLSFVCMQNSYYGVRCFPVISFAFDCLANVFAHKPNVICKRMKMNTQTDELLQQ